MQGLANNVEFPQDKQLTGPVLIKFMYSLYV